MIGDAEAIPTTKRPCHWPSPSIKFQKYSQQAKRTVANILICIIESRGVFVIMQR